MIHKRSLIELIGFEVYRVFCAFGVGNRLGRWGGGSVMYVEMEMEMEMDGDFGGGGRKGRLDLESDSAYNVQ